MTDDAPRCSVAARDRGEPMAGTAPVAGRWLLVEHPGPWARDPLATAPIAGPVGAALAAAAVVAGARILLVRRGPRRRGAARAWYAVDLATRTWVTGTWAEPEDLLGPPGSPWAGHSTPAPRPRVR